MDKLCGLNNIGNTCYLNSALQLLINCTVLSKFMLSFNFKSEKFQYEQILMTPAGDPKQAFTYFRRFLPIFN